MAGDLQLRVRLSADGQQLIGELKAAENSVQKFGSTVASGIVTAAKWATGIVAAGAAVTTYLVAANADAIRQIDQFADSLGMSTQTLTEWQYAAESVGVAGENMQSIFQDLQDKIGDFATTGGGEATDVFESLNIAVADLMNLSPAEQLTAIADAMQDVNQNQKVFFMESLASDSTRLLPLLENNAAALKKLQLEAQVLGRSISDVDAAKVTESALAIDRTQGLITGLANEITVSLAPMLTGVSNMLFESAVEAGGFGNAVETAVDGAVTGLGFVLDVGQQLLVWSKHAQVGMMTLGQHGSGAMASIADTTAAVINHSLYPFQQTLAWIIEKVSSLVELGSRFGGPFADSFKEASEWLGTFSNDVKKFEVQGADIVALNERMQAGLSEAAAELEALLNTNAPSEDLKNWVQRLREESEAAAAASVRLRNESKSTGIVVGNDAAAYASTLAKSTSSSVKSLSDVEKQSQRVWAALDAGKISAAQAATAIDGLASAGAGLVNEQQQWIDQMIAAMDPARALQEEITTLQETFEDGLFGDLSEDKFNDYIDSLKKKLAELNGVKIQDPAVQMGSAMQIVAGGIKDVAGAMQGMYSEGERGYQDMAVAMQAANVVAAVGAVLQQGMGDPYTAFARMAAMAAAVAGLGYSVGIMGGSAPDDAAIRQSQQGTGTVLGDSSAKSESIAKSIDVTASATSELVGINRGMLRALEEMQLGIGGASVMVAQQMGRTSFDYGGGRTEIAKPTNIFDKASDFVSGAGIGVLGSLASGIFKVTSKILGGKSQVTDEGIKIVGASLADMMEETLVSGYQTTRTRKNRFASWKTHEATAALSDDIALQFNRVFKSLADSVYQGATALGFAGDDVSDKINGFVIETQKISLKGLDAEEQQAEIEAVFSVMFDNLAESTVAFLPKFQQAGEALGETLARVATNVQVAEEAVFRLGFAAENINPEQFATLSVYLIDAAGGMEQFISSMSSFVDKFAPESHKLDLLAADMERSLAAVGLSVPSTRDEMWQLMQTLDATTESGAEQVATLLRLTGTADAYYKMLESGTGSAAAAVQKLSQALQDFVRNTQNGTQSLQMQLLQMQGNTEAIRNAERSRIQNALNDQLNAANAQQNILAEQRAAATAAEQQLAEAMGQTAAFAIAQSTGAAEAVIDGVLHTADQIADGLDYWNQKAASAADALGTLGAGSADFAEQMQTLQNEMQSAEKASAEYLAAQEAIWREQDAQAAEQQAAAVAEKRFDLENQLLRLQGNELAAVAREREKELEALRALSPELVELQQQIWAAHDAVQGDDGLDKYLQKVADFAQKELQRIEGDYQERIKLAEEQMRIGRELRQYVEQLRISELSPYDPGEKLQLATEQFAALLVRAEAGDMEAARLLQSSAQAYLQNADAYYGRSDPYLTIFEEVTRSLDRLGLDIMGGLDDNTAEKLNQQLLQEQQRIRDYAQQQLSWVVAQHDALTSIEQLLSILPDNLSSQLNDIINPTAAHSGTAQMVLAQWDAMGGGAYSRADLDDYARRIDSGAVNLSDINADLNYYRNNQSTQNQPLIQQVLDLWQQTGGGFYKTADLEDYASRIASGSATLSKEDLDYYRKTRIHGSHKNGLRSVPFDGYIGELHKKERVLTEKEAAEYNSFDSGAIVAKLDQLCAEKAALRQEVAQLRAERKSDAATAEQQRDRQLRAAIKTPEVI